MVKFQVSDCTGVKKFICLDSVPNTSKCSMMPVESACSSVKSLQKVGNNQKSAFYIYMTSIFQVHSFFNSTNILYNTNFSIIEFILYKFYSTLRMGSTSRVVYVNTRTFTLLSVLGEIISGTKRWLKCGVVYRCIVMFILVE